MSKNSSFFKHSKEINHQINNGNFGIIDKSNNNIKLSYKEMLHMIKSKRILNSQEHTYHARYLTVPRPRFKSAYIICLAIRLSAIAGLTSQGTLLACRQT